MKLLPILLLTFALSLGVACASEPAVPPTATPDVPKYSKGEVIGLIQNVLRSHSDEDCSNLLNGSYKFSARRFQKEYEEPKIRKGLTAEQIKELTEYFQNPVPVATEEPVWGTGYWVVNVGMNANFGKGRWILFEGSNAIKTEAPCRR